MDTLEEIHDVKKSTFWAQKQGKQHCLSHWNNNAKKVSNPSVISDHHTRPNQMMNFAPMEGIPSKASCSSWISAGIVTFSYRFY